MRIIETLTINRFSSGSPVALFGMGTEGIERRMITEEPLGSIEN